MSPARTVTRRSTAGRRRTKTARRRPARRRKLDPKQWWPAGLIALVVLVGLAWDAGGKDAPMATAQCTLPATGVTLTGEQVTNARTIAQVAYDRGLPERAVVIALATAM